MISVVNLKLEKDVKNLFASTVKKNGETMQSILTAFVDIYIENPKIIERRVVWKKFN